MNRPATLDDPVGVFDSGVGGVSVLLEIHKALPAEDQIYLRVVMLGDSPDEFDTVFPPHARLRRDPRRRNEPGGASD